MTRILCNTLTAITLVALILGCGAADTTAPIEETRQVDAPRPPADPEAATGERLAGRKSAAPQAPGADMEATAAEPAAMPPDLFEYDVPEGWVELDPTDMRLINLQPAGNPEAECTVSILPGDGAAVAENINRWRGQMGQEPLPDEEIAGLPKVSLLGRDATFVTIEGAYAGMTGGPGKPDFTLAGLVLELPNAGIFVKFVGPKDVVAAETDNFIAFYRSMSLAGMGTPPPAEPDTAEAEPPMPGEFETGDAALSWTAPEGWEETAPRPMREVTYQAGEDGAAECYIIKLPGEAGGVTANLNRWAQQMGKQPMSPDTLAALPVINVLGEDVPLLELTGTYTGMSGEVTEDARFLGTIAMKDNESIFIRMTGPDGVVADQKANFIAFCESLE